MNERAAMPPAVVAADEEFGGLGMIEGDSKRSDNARQEEMFKALGMRSISIRLPDNLIDGFKAVANLQGVGYQPLMRDVLERWLLNELRHLAELQSASLTAAKRVAAEEALEASGCEPPQLPKAA